MTTAAPTTLAATTLGPTTMAPTTMEPADWYEASSIWLVEGTVNSGRLDDTYLDDGTEFVINEIPSASPGFDFQIYFDNIPTYINWFGVILHGYYDGNPAHVVYFQIWNYSTSAWETLEQLLDASSEQAYNWGPFKSEDYVQSQGCKVRIVHTSTGSAGHYFHIDQIRLYKTAASKNSTNFSEYYTARNPGDWSQRWDTSLGEAPRIRPGSGYGKKELLHDQEDLGFYAVSWDKVGTPEDAEVLTHVKAIVAREDAFKVILRGSGSTGTENGYIAYADITNNKFYLARLYNGSLANLGSYDITLNAGIYYWVRLNVEGSAIKAKIWGGDFSVEPPFWQISVTNSAVTGQGWAGVGGYYGEVVVDYFSVGAYGAEAEDPEYLTTAAPTTLVTTTPPTTVLTTPAPPTTLATFATTIVPTTIVPTTFLSTEPPTTLTPTTLAPTAGPTTLGPTTGASVNYILQNAAILGDTESLVEVQQVPLLEGVSSLYSTIYQVVAFVGATWTPSPTTVPTTTIAPGGLLGFLPDKLTPERYEG